MIRDVTHHDVQEIVESLQQLRIESPAYNGVADDPEHVAANLHALISKGLIVGPIEPGRGYMLGTISSMWYDARIVAAEQLLYITPQYRGGSLAVRLIKAFEGMARARGAAFIYAGASTGIKDSRTINLYKHLGYAESGQSVKKELDYV